MIVLERLSKHYGGTPAVQELSLTIADGEVCVLVGPSGCGKTTTLRMINRLVEPSGGRIVIDGQDVTEMDPVQLRRRIGYVIQTGGLFPHRRVVDNVATVPRLIGWDKARTRRRVEEMLELVGLDPARYGRRFPHELSGGERQRVGVARALAADPPVLLMDEPFASVDPVTRHNLQQQLLELQRKLRKTVVLVTHDIDEAATLGDRVAVLSKGAVLEQYDTPAEILGRPSSPFVADFVGTDRGVRRLGVVPIRPDDPFRPLEVRPSTTMEDVADLARRERSRSQSDGRGPSDVDLDWDVRWAVVVSEEGALLGWVPTGETTQGTVAEHLQPFSSQVPLGASMRAALSEMLEHDVAWVPVVDGGRYLGVLSPNRIQAAMRRAVRDGPSGHGRGNGNAP